jgi:hypothetical protein
MSFESIVGRLPHKDFCDTELNIRLGKDQRNRLMLHTTNLFRPANTVLVRVQFAVFANSRLVLGAFL